MVSIDNQVAQLVIEYHRYSSVYFSVNGYIYVYTIYILICKVSFIPSLEFVAIPPLFLDLSPHDALDPLKGPPSVPSGMMLLLVAVPLEPLWLKWHGMFILNRHNLLPTCAVVFHSCQLSRQMDI